DQPGTIIPQRTNPVSVAEFAPKTLNIRRKSYFGPLSNFTIHVSTSRANPESSQIIDSRTRSVRPSDSVRLLQFRDVVRRHIMPGRIARGAASPGIFKVGCGGRVDNARSAVALYSSGGGSSC